MCEGKGDATFSHSSLSFLAFVIIFVIEFISELGVGEYDSILQGGINRYHFLLLNNDIKRHYLVYNIAMESLL